MEACSLLSLYRNLKTKYKPAPYLYNVLNWKYRNAIGKLRLSSNTLFFETGRYIRPPRQDRKCVYCDLNDIEDEYHFVLRYTKYFNHSHVNFLFSYYSNHSSFYKFDVPCVLHCRWFSNAIIKDSIVILTSTTRGPLVL